MPARLIQRAAEIDWDWLGSRKAVGLTAGASAPEVLVEEVIEALRERFVLSDGGTGSRARGPDLQASARTGRLRA